MAATNLYWAIINSGTGIVTNIILWNPDEEPNFEAEKGHELIADPNRQAWIGATWDGTNFSPYDPDPDPEGML